MYFNIEQLTDGSFVYHYKDMSTYGDKTGSAKTLKELIFKMSSYFNDCYITSMPVTTPHSTESEE